MATVTPPTTARRVKKPLKKWTFRYVLLQFHLYLGLVSAVFLVILGVTGAIIGFEQEIPRWLHPSLWYVTPASQTLPDAQLIRNVEQRFAPSHVSAITLPRSRDISQVMQLPAGDSRSGRRVFVNQYTGAILGSMIGRTTDENVLQAIHSFHLRIGMDDTGKLIVSIAGLILVFEVIFGLILWWRLKRVSIRLKGSWFRVVFDSHNAIGIYSAFFLLLAAVTGVVIGFDFMEPLIFHITHSEPLVQRRLPNSVPIPGANRITADQAIAFARTAMPEGTVAGLQLPAKPKAAYVIQMRTEETAPAVHSFVVIDQYSGKVLAMQKFKSSLGYRVIRFNRSLHTGDIFGSLGHAIMSLTSLVLVAMVVSGIVIWWKKLAI